MSAKYPNQRPTRVSFLNYACIAPGLWMFIDRTDPTHEAQVGPHYGSRAELLTDSSNYFRDAWGIL